MKISIGVLLFFLGIFLIYQKLNQKILVEKKREYFYIPPHIIKFWGLSLAMILFGVLLIFQGLSE